MRCALLGGCRSRSWEQAEREDCATAFARALETFAFRHASHVTTICAGLKREIVARGIPEQRVTIIPNAVDVDAFAFCQEPDLALMEKPRPCRQDGRGFHRLFYAYEGLDLLLAALPEIIARMPDARVLLVGGGPQENTLKSPGAIAGPR